MLTLTDYDSDLGVYRALDADSVKYFIDAQAVDENRQWAEATGQYAGPDAAWEDADNQWTPDMEGVSLAATWPNA